MLQWYFLASSQDYDLITLDFNGASHGAQSLIDLQPSLHTSPIMTKCSSPYARISKLNTITTLWLPCYTDIELSLFSFLVSFCFCFIQFNIILRSYIRIPSSSKYSCKSIYSHLNMSEHFISRILCYSDISELVSHSADNGFTMN